MKAAAGNIKELDHQKNVIAARVKKRTNEVVELKKQIEGLSLNIEVHAGDDEKLYGSVTNSDIAEELEKQDIMIDKRKILIEEPIRKLGIYNVKIHLQEEIDAELRVWIINKKVEE